MRGRARWRSSGSETTPDVRSGPDTQLREVPQTMTRIRRQTVFAGLDQTGTWPRTPRAHRPERLELALHSLPGVAPTAQRKLGPLRRASVRDVLEPLPP